jgi:hypothetical protein
LPGASPLVFAAVWLSVRKLLSILGPECFAVRGILFNKTQESNWKVVWHQDLTIAVRERREADGFGPWGKKAGVSHDFRRWLNGPNSRTGAKYQVTKSPGIAAI